MKKICIKVEVIEDQQEKRPTRTKVTPYIRVRNGKKELVRGYIRKSRNL